MAEYTNGCAECREKLKKDLGGILTDLCNALEDEKDRLFWIGSAYGKLSYIIDEIPDKEAEDTK